MHNSHFNLLYLAEWMRYRRVVRASDCQCQIRNSPVAKFIIPEWDMVDFGIGLSYRPASLYLAWLEGTTTLCRSRSQHPTAQWNHTDGCKKRYFTIGTTHAYSTRQQYMPTHILIHNIIREKQY
jgi:hypothetical protein